MTTNEAPPVGSIVNEYVLGDFKLSMWIPTELAGKVIGKKGTVITNIQRETGAHVINACPSIGESLWMAVAIIGEIKSIIAAYNTISTLVSEGEKTNILLLFFCYTAFTRQILLITN